MLPLARALAEAGHDVAFATAAEFAPSITKRGFGFFPAGISLPRQLEEAKAHFREGDQPPSKERFETFVPRMLGGVAAPTRATDLVPVVEEWRPDVLVHDETEFGGAPVAARFGIPWADQSVGIMRPLVMAQRAAAEAAPLWEASGRLPGRYGGMFEYLYLDVCPPSLQSAEIALVPVAHPVHNLSVAGPGDGSLPIWVDTLGPDPTIYVSLGTVFNRDNPVFRAILAGLRDEPVNVIVTLGSDNDPADLGPQPPHIHVERFIPQALILPHCDAVVNQGGTAVLDILGNGLPLLVLPQGANQFHNAEACVRAGVGRRLLPAQVNPDSVRREVRALLDEPEYRDRARAVQRELASMPGPAEGVKLVERLAEERLPLRDRGPAPRRPGYPLTTDPATTEAARPATTEAARPGWRERSWARDAAGRSGEVVRLCGWVEAAETDGAFSLRDASGTIPIAAPGATVAPAVGAAVEVVGTVGAAGVIAHEVQVVGEVLDPLPIGPDSPLESRLDWRFLELRRPRNRLIFEVQTTAEEAMREYWAAEGFLELHSPKLRPNPNRSGRELFSVPYFDRQAYLVQSPQFYKQMAMAAGFDRVFEVGPVFRANPMVTSRHDTEFTSVDVEISWIDSTEDVMAWEERWLRHTIAAIKTRHGDDISRLFGVSVEVPDIPFPRVALEAARALVQSCDPALAQPTGDLDPAGERALGDYVNRQWGHEFVFVTEYPAATRPFYHMRSGDDPPRAHGFDLLWKGLEVTTGAQREHRYDILVQQAIEQGIALEPIRYYLDCFRFGCPPHGGFGLGLSRMLMSLLGIDNVREATFLYRGIDRLSP